MSRSLKPQKVGAQKVGPTFVELFLDRNKLVFFVQLDGERIEAKTADELKDVLRKRGEDYRALTWSKFIRAEVSNGYERYAHSTQLTLQIERFELAPSRLESAKFMERPFLEDVSEHGDLERQQRRDTRPSWRTPKGLLPYTEETWQGLIRLIAAVDAIRVRAEALVENPAALQSGALLLGSGQPE